MNNLTYRVPKAQAGESQNLLSIADPYPLKISVNALTSSPGDIKDFMLT